MPKLPPARRHALSDPRHAVPRLVGMALTLLLVLSSLAAAQTDFKLPGLPGKPAATAGLGGGDHATVSAEANFAKVQPGQQLVVAVVLDVEAGFHAQSHRPLQDNLIPFALQKLQVSAGDVFEPIYPPGEIENFPALTGPDTNGDVSVYSGKAVIYVPIQISPDAKAGGPLTVSGTAFYQICNDQNCFAPKSTPWEVNVDVAATAEPANADSADLFAGFDPTVWSKLQPAAAAPAAAPTSLGGSAFSLFGWTLDLQKHGAAVAFPLAFLAGIIFNVVPCVLPVLPLKALSFYEVAKHDRGKCLALGVAFSLGITLTFAALAVLVLVLRIVEWGQLFGQTWFAATLGAILVGMALYQFGFFTIPLPQSVYAVTPRHDTYSGNVLFGVLTAILSTPCTFGLFAALLFWASSQSAWVGVPAVTLTGVGMASPYLLLSAFPELARKFPRTGPWSELVKQATGFLLLAVAAYFVRPLLPDSLRGPDYWWLVYGCLAAGGLFAVAQAWRYGKGRLTPIFVTAAVAAVVLVPGGLLANRLANPPAGWTEFTPAALAAAREKGGPVLVKFTADWCANCQTVEQRVFGTQAQMDGWRDDGVTLLKADLTKPDAVGWPLLKELNRIGAIPFTAVYLPGRGEPAKLAGIYGTGDLRAVLGE